jgi:hypothetical protein
VVRDENLPPRGAPFPLGMICFSGQIKAGKGGGGSVWRLGRGLGRRLNLVRLGVFLPTLATGIFPVILT